MGLGRAGKAVRRGIDWIEVEGSPRGIMGEKV